jgi:hypothetical protein
MCRFDLKILWLGGSRLGSYPKIKVRNHFADPDEVLQMISLSRGGSRLGSYPKIKVRNHFADPDDRTIVYSPSGFF